ncbi:sigma-70 family RNA polymerase sigma factor [Candidatus Woesearchaeota archaeon]|nr:sigma-70 family RNA polymerase sigma factor [Candidatus Woesearchaeota archaeon]
MVIKDAEGLIQYLGSFIDFFISRHIRATIHHPDVRQEVSMALFLIWQKYQAGEINYLTVRYTKATVRNTVMYYIRSQGNQLNQTGLAQGSPRVEHIEHKDVMDLLCLPSEERQREIKSAQSRIMGELSPRELQVYDLINEGYTQQEVCRRLTLGFHQYTKIRLKIKELFKKYL